MAMSPEVVEGVCKFCGSKLDTKYFVERLTTPTRIPYYNFFCKKECYRAHQDEVISCSCPFLCKRHTECECDTYQHAVPPECMFCSTGNALLKFPTLLRVVAKLKVIKCPSSID